MSNQPDLNSLRHMKMWRFLFIRHSKTNEERIDLAKGTIDGKPVAEIAQSIGAYSRRHWFIKFLQRLFTSINEKVILFRLYLTLGGGKDMFMSTSAALSAYRLKPTSISSSPAPHATKIAKQQQATKGKYATTEATPSSGVYETIKGWIPKPIRNKCNFWPFNRNDTKQAVATDNVPINSDYMVLTKNEKAAWAALVRMHNETFPSDSLNQTLTSEQATFKEVRQVFRALSLHFHPDKQQDNDGKLNASGRFIIISTHYQKLSAAKLQQEERKVTFANGTFDENSIDQANPSNSSCEEGAEIEKLNSIMNQLAEKIHSYNYKRDIEKLIEAYNKLAKTSEKLADCYSNAGVYANEEKKAEFIELAHLYANFAAAATSMWELQKQHDEISNQAAAYEAEMEESIARVENKLARLEKLNKPKVTGSSQPVIVVQALQEDPQTKAVQDGAELLIETPLNRYRLFPSQDGQQEHPDSFMQMPHLKSSETKQLAQNSIMEHPR